MPNRQFIYGVILLAFAASFSITQQRASDTESQCQSQLYELRALSAQSQMRSIENAVAEIRIEILQIRRANFSTGHVLAHTKEIASIDKDRDSLRKDAHENGRFIQILSRDIALDEKKTSELCEEASHLRGRASFFVIIMTLFAASYGLWLSSPAKV